MLDILYPLDVHILYILYIHYIIYMYTYIIFIENMFSIRKLYIYSLYYNTIYYISSICIN